MKNIVTLIFILIVTWILLSRFFEAIGNFIIKVVSKIFKGM